MTPSKHKFPYNLIVMKLNLTFTNNNNNNNKISTYSVAEKGLSHRVFQLRGRMENHAW